MILLNFSTVVITGLDPVIHAVSYLMIVVSVIEAEFTVWIATRSGRAQALQARQ
ncbi:hypothetical protein [Roseibium sp.]|uniref:hypothetical protein n=1 Tax=Roseibium sp. TaxID=1936156 RepID=UPI003B51D0EC